MRKCKSASPTSQKINKHQTKEALMNYEEILKCYEGVTEQHANTSFEFGLMNDTYYNLFREHDLLEYANSNSVH